MKIILRNKYTIENGLIRLTLVDSIDGVAYKCSSTFSNIDPIENLNIKKTDKIQIVDTIFGENYQSTIFNGIVWGRDKGYKNNTIDLTCKERTVYLENSEDEYLFGKGTADERIKQIAKDWNIPLGKIPNTGVKLEKKLEKGNLLSIIRKFLKETVEKDGKMYFLRMEDKLNMYELGSNTKVYNLEVFMVDAKETNSLEGAVTQVKVLGKSKDEKHKTPVLGTFDKDKNKIGTLQRLKQDDKIKNKKDAEKAAKAMFSTGEETIHFTGAVDINVIRAGDKVRLYGKEYYVYDVTHNRLPHATMSINAGTKDYIRRKFYSD